MLFLESSSINYSDAGAKSILLGEAGVGKSALATRYVLN